MKKRVKIGQLSLLFSLMIAGILIFIIIISFSNYNKVLKKDLIGELGTIGPSVSDVSVLTENPTFRVPLYQLHTTNSFGWYFYFAAGDGDKNGAIASGYTYDRIKGYIYVTNVSGSVPLYQLHKINPSGSWTFYFAAGEGDKNGAIASGYTYDRIKGYIYVTNVSGSTPLYQLHKINSDGSWTFYLAAGEGDKNGAISAGYTYDGIKGYIYTYQYSAPLPFHRVRQIFNPDVWTFFYTINNSEMIKATTTDGYTYETITGFLNPTPVPDSTAFYRLYKNDLGVFRFFYTDNASEKDLAISRDGYIDNGIAGYIFTSQINGTVPLYMLYKDYGQNIYSFFYTINSTERDISDFNYSRIVGYIFPSSSQPVLYLPFEGNANDSSIYENNGKVFGASLAIGKQGQGYSFNGANSFINVSDSYSLGLTNAWTLSAWVKVDPSFNNLGEIIAKRGWTTGPVANYALRTNGFASGWDCFFYNNGWKGAWSIGTIHKGEWHYITCSYDGVNTIRIYEDGNLIGSNNTLSSPPPVNNFPVEVGAYTGPLEIFKGSIDEVKIWNYALNNNEIINEYDNYKKLIAHYSFERNLSEAKYDDNFDGAIFNNTKWSILREGTWNQNSGTLNILTKATDFYRNDNNATLFYQYINSNNPYEISVKVTANPDKNYTQGGIFFYQNDDNYVRLTYIYYAGIKCILSKEIGGVFSDEAIIPCPNGNVYLKLKKNGNNYYAYYSSDGIYYNYIGSTIASITTNIIGISAFNQEGYWFNFDNFIVNQLNNNILDVSGNGNNGVNNGSSLTIGKAGYGYDFNGIDNYIEISNSLSLQDFTEESFSWSAWYYPKSLPGNIFTHEVHNIICKPGYHTSLFYNNYSNIGIYTWNYSNYSTIVPSESNNPPNNWYYVAGVVDSSSKTVSIYVNGDLKQFRTYNGNLHDYETMFIRIGICNNPGDPWDWPANGTIDEVKIWNYALSASEIKSDYNCSYNCSGATPKCNSNGQCVQCINNNDCPDGQTCNSSGQCSGTGPDTTPPVISSIASYPASRSVGITWNTDENSNASVNYGTNLSNITNFGIDTNMIMSHSVTISGLTSSTLYYYNITCCDSSGNCATSEINNFTTTIYTDEPGPGPGPSPNPTPRVNNTRISFEDKSIEVGKLIEVSISTEGLNQSRLNYSAKNLPTGASFDSRTGRFSWTPYTAGEYIFNLSVTDKKLTYIKIVRITVSEPVVIPPVPPTPTPNKSGGIIFWVIVITIILIAIIIVIILIVFYIDKKQRRIQSKPPLNKS